MLIYHLGVTSYARQLTGEGAKLYGGRWNLQGIPCLYAGETKSLCALEYAANVLLENMPADLSFTTYEIPDNSWTSFSPKDLPVDWKETPPPESTQTLGSKLLQNRLAIRVPSAIIPSEFNFVINPLHADFKKVRIKEVEPFSFDKRIKT